jgi:hypothetical protein
LTRHNPSFTFTYSGGTHQTPSQSVGASAAVLAAGRSATFSASAGFIGTILESLARRPKY